MEAFEENVVELVRMGYVDLHNKEHRLHQMKTLFDDPRYIISKLFNTQSQGCCVGEICPRYIDMGEMKPRKIVKRRWRKRMRIKRLDLIKDDPPKVVELLEGHLATNWVCSVQWRRTM